MDTLASGADFANISLLYDMDRSILKEDAKMTGVSPATKKNGSIYYRSGITYRGRHISLGSFSTEDTAAAAYLDASKLFADAAVTLVDFSSRTFYALL